MAQSELILTNSCGMRQEIWQAERLEGQVRELAKQYAREQTQLAAQVEPLTGNMQQLGAHVDIDQRIRGSFKERKQNDQRLQRCCQGYERTLSLIHGEAEQKRKSGDRWDRGDSS